MNRGMYNLTRFSSISAPGLIWPVLAVMVTFSPLARAESKSNASDERTWVSLSGSKVAGTLLEIDGKTVSIRAQAGRVIQIDLVSLSRDDRLFLEGTGNVPPEHHLRSWTSNAGKKLEASLVRVDGDNVTLISSNREFRVQLSSLSEADQTFVRDLESAKRKQLLELPFGKLKEGERVTLTVPVPDSIRQQIRDGVFGDISLGLTIDMSIAAPKNFDPGKPNKFLIISAPGNGRSAEAMNSFWKTGVERGWIVIGCSLPGEKDGDALIRMATILSGLDVLHQAWPGSRKWPVAAAGNSGGAKMTGTIGALLVKHGYNLIGIFKGGCNQQFIGTAINDYKPDKARLLKTPIFLSSGLQDTVATPRMFGTVERQLNELGFKHVRLENYDGEHSVNQAQIAMALDWFVQMAGADN